jgi:hypothetical protein
MSVQCRAVAVSASQLRAAEADLTADVRASEPHCSSCRREALVEQRALADPDLISEQGVALAVAGQLRTAAAEPATNVRAS